MEGDLEQGIFISFCRGAGMGMLLRETLMARVT